LLGDFDPKDAGPEPLRSGAPVTLWMHNDYKERYDRLQKMSGRRFSKMAREVLEALIDLAEKRAS
jgi:predicted DNA-binding protein